MQSSSVRAWFVRVLIPLVVGVGLPVTVAGPALAADLVVNASDDADDGACNSSHCSFREAINDANATPGVTDAITFDASLAGATIQPATALPSITAPVTIDGDTDAGAGVSRIELDGSSLSSGSGLTLVSATGSVIRNMVIGRFPGDGVTAALSSGVTLTGNIIGLDTDGTTAAGNAGLGIWLGAGATVGGTTAPLRNIISSNGTSGIMLNSVSGSMILGNFIGTDAAGTLDRGNTQYGIRIVGSAGGVHQIGGTLAGQGNVLSGNGLAGVSVGNSSPGPTIEGNLIGTDATGESAIANGTYGVEVAGAIPGTTVGPGNVISGNANDGVGIYNVSSQRPTGTVVKGNWIGTDDDGTTDLGNASDGVAVTDAGAGTLIGGLTSSDGNVISGNDAYGVNLSGASSGYTVQGNIVGLNAAGSAAIANGSGGIFEGGAGTVIGGTDGVTIGGACTGACNVISGNTGHGLVVNADPTVQGNFIGTDITGLLDLGNTGMGIRVSASQGAQIGGTTAGARNVVSGNSLSGISLEDTNAREAAVQGNYVGIGTDGTTAIGNSQNGIRVGSGHDNTIGGTVPGSANLIAHNSQQGVFVATAGADRNRILGNTIRDNGMFGIKLGGFASPLANDPGDVDAGPNEEQNHPVLAGAYYGNGNTFVRGSLDSLADGEYRIEVFGNTACDASGSGEGATFLGAGTATTGPSGLGALGILTSGEQTGPVTATATDGPGNTSEFSTCATPVEDQAAPTAMMGSLGGVFSLGGSFPASWSGHDGVGVGLGTFDVTRRSATHKKGFGAPSLWQDDTTTTGADHPGAPGRTYCLSAAATDALGNEGGISPQKCVAVPLDDRALARAGGFKKRNDPGAFRGTISEATTKGASLTLLGARADRMALVFDRCPACGKVLVRFAGSSKVVNTRGPNLDQRLVMVFNLAGADKGKLKIVSLSDKRVRIDGVGLSAV